MNEFELLQKLRKYSGCDEIKHKTSFVGYREAKDGHAQRVEIDIFDAGPDVQPNLRYSCLATSDDGKYATGNPDSSIDAVLATVHWYELDQ